MTVDPKDVATLGAKLDAWIALETALREDLMGVLDLLDHAPDNQSLRRALIRSLWGFVEGSIYGVSDYLRTAHSLANDGMEGPPDRAKTLERVKAVLKEAARDLAGWRAYSFRDTRMERNAREPQNSRSPNASEERERSADI